MFRKLNLFEAEQNRTLSLTRYWKGFARYLFLLPFLSVLVYDQGDRDTVDTFPIGKLQGLYDRREHAIEYSTIPPPTTSSRDSNGVVYFSIYKKYDVSF